MNKVELQAIIHKWWVWNEKQSQVGEAYQFIQQIGDHNSGFKRWTMESYQPDTSFECVRCKEVKGGLSIRLESSDGVTDGILEIKTGEWVEKVIVGDVTGSFVVRGASIDG